MITEFNQFYSDRPSFSIYNYISVGSRENLQKTKDLSSDSGSKMAIGSNEDYKSKMSQPTIESILQEKRLFQPPAELSQKAHIKSLDEYKQLYEKAKADPEGFWAELAEQELDWFQKWDKVLDWQPPFAKWFIGGKINISYNCLDRHLTTWRRNKAAFYLGRGTRRLPHFHLRPTPSRSLSDGKRLQAVRNGDLIKSQ